MTQSGLLRNVRLMGAPPTEAMIEQLPSTYGFKRSWLVAHDGHDVGGASAQ